MTLFLIQWGTLLIIPLLSLFLIHLTKIYKIIIFLCGWLVGAYILTRWTLHLEVSASDPDIDIIFGLSVLFHSILLGAYYGIVILAYCFFTFLISIWFSNGKK